MSNGQPGEAWDVLCWGRKASRVWHEPYKSRDLRTVLWAAGGAIPLADPADWLSGADLKPLQAAAVKAVVASVEAKGGARLCQVRLKQTNESEPLITCRNPSDDVETGAPKCYGHRKVLAAGLREATSRD